MKDLHVCGLGNSLVDILLPLTQEEFNGLGLEKGTMRLVEAAEQTALLKQFHDRDPRLASGGSVANSIIALSQLGGRGGFIGCVGDDRYGLFYQQEFEQLGINIGNPAIVGETTGTCVSIITPDAERTMRTCLAVSSHLAERHVETERIARSEWLFIEGYVFANPETGQGAIVKALQAARENNVKVAVTCSEAFVPTVFGEPFRAALQQTALLFCNAVEACALTNAGGAEEAFSKLKGMVPAAVVTDGPNGAFIRFDGVEQHVPAFPCEPKDLTGAGDMFAGAFLYGITHGIHPATAARAANFLAMKVITQVGARLHQGTREFWDLAVAK